VQKFTRPLTREIELNGERLGLTLSATGLSVRPVGSRRPPLELGWDAVLCLLTRAGASGPPTTEEVAAALDALRQGAPRKPAPAAGPAAAAPVPTSPPEGPAVATTMETLLERLERSWAKNRPGFVEGLLPGASVADLAGLHGQLGLPVPDDLAKLLAWHNGQSAESHGRFVQDFVLMGSAQIVEARNYLQGEKVAGWQPSLVPLLDDDQGNYLCLDTSTSPAAVREFWQDQPHHPPVAPSLKAWLEQFVTDVEAGKYREDPERGTFLLVK